MRTVIRVAGHGCVVACLGMAATVAQADQAVEDVARQHYNAGRFSQAIEVAAPLWKTTASPQMGLVLARAQLEQFRVTEARDTLVEAIAVLRRIDPKTLDVADAAAWDEALAMSLFHDGQYGAAAELFDQHLHAMQDGVHAARDRLLDWWATAVDRNAQQYGSASRAQMIYEDLLVRLLAERDRSSESAVVPYWLVVAARGAGQVGRAWDLAVAGWVQAVRLGARRTQLRTDLDRLMTLTIIPELAAMPSPHDGAAIEPLDVLTARTNAWNAIKATWP